ncbi:MAG: hypothetical protein ACUVUG_05925 [Candidatus Aminicenantia bacterium]
MLYKDENNLLEPKEGYIERFWNVTLPKYRRKKRVKAIISSIAGIFFIFALIFVLKFSSKNEDIFMEDVWNDVYAMIENEPNYYKQTLVWITDEELQLFEQIKNEKK